MTKCGDIYHEEYEEKREYFDRITGFGMIGRDGPRNLDKNIRRFLEQCPDRERGDEYLMTKSGKVFQLVTWTLKMGMQ